ncbi:DEAD/DEAH box helicase [Candidatus Micrarchaeota archaeon]|nr:DEAD/DEAH box helicase [Candidatus Micrarchaeota archaeon]
MRKKENFMKKETLSKETISALDKMRFTDLTEVQKRVIPLILEGKGVICRSKTGTGKTAAFGIAMVERIITGKTRKGLVITPTRELAVQVSNELARIGKDHKISVITIYGGVSISMQIEKLHKHPQIVVATPGRLLDLINRRQVFPQDFDFVVLDEADIMLDMGFIKDIDNILGKIIPTPQIALFSATIDKDILEMADYYIKDYEYITISDMDKPIEISEQILEVVRKERFGALLDILYKNRNKKIMIFLNTKRNTDRIAEKLSGKRFKVGALHGDMSQRKREQVLKDFKKGRINILVATDVAARGIHVDNIDIVINYDLARTSKMHLHRIGRTGRMNHKGMAISLNIIDQNNRRDSYLPPVETVKYQYHHVSKAI